MIKYYLDRQKRLEKQLAENKKHIEACVGGDVSCILPDGTVVLENPPLGVVGSKVGAAGYIFYWYEFEVDGIKVAHISKTMKGD